MTFPINEYLTWWSVHKLGSRHNSSEIMTLSNPGLPIGHTVKKIVQSPIKMHWYTIFLNRDKGKN